MGGRTQAVDVIWWWAAIALLIGEILSLTAGPMIVIGFVPISWSLLAAPVLLVATRRWWSRSASMVRVDLVLAGAAACAATWFVGVLGDGRSAAALVLPSMTEELAYRVAGPAVLTAVAVALGCRQRMGLILAMVLSSVMFALMPGHVAQITSATGLLPFIAFSFLYTMVVWRTRNLLGAVLAHVTMNLFTFPLQLSPDPRLDHGLAFVRAAGVGIVTMVFVAGSYWAHDLETSGSPHGTDPEADRDDAIVIDLREPNSRPSGRSTAPVDLIRRDAASVR